MGINFLLYFLLITVAAFGLFYTQYSYLQLKRVLKSLPFKDKKLKVGTDIFLKGFYRFKPVEIRISRQGKVSLPFAHFTLSVSFPFEMQVFRGGKTGSFSPGYRKIEIGDEEFNGKYLIEVKDIEPSLVRAYLNAERQHFIELLFHDYNPGITRPWVNMISFDKSSVEVVMVNCSYKTFNPPQILRIFDLLNALVS